MIQSCVLLMLLVVAPANAGAQSAAKVRHIGVLSPFSAPLPSQSQFDKALGELGGVVGKHLVLEYRYARGQPDRLRVLAAELARLHVDVIVPLGTIAALAAKQATATIPIVIVVGATRSAPVWSGASRDRAAT